MRKAEDPERRSSRARLWGTRPRWPGMVARVRIGEYASGEAKGNDHRCAESSNWSYTRQALKEMAGRELQVRVFGQMGACAEVT